MNLFIAGTMSRPYVTESGEGFKILESFYYCRDNEVIPKLLPILGDFLLDSGAFSFMQGEHLCKTMRGVKKPGLMFASRLDGVFREDKGVRSEFLTLARELLGK